VVAVNEVGPDWNLRRARFASRNGFRAETLPDRQLEPGILVDGPDYRIRAAFLDHGTPCLGFAFDEAFHINVWKPRLHALGLPTGAWLTDLRRQVRAGAPADTPVTIRWQNGHGECERTMSVGELKQQVLEITPGQRVCYVTDVAMSEANAARIAALAAGCDLLYIEAAFLDADADHARRKSHLTARFAGELAARSRVREAVPLHFSTRYLGEGELLEREFAEARRGAPDAGALPRRMAGREA
jgi:ribonuclease Z